MIYAGLGVYAVYQARPKAKDTEVLSALAWPSLVAILGCAAWIVASAKDWKWASVAIILTSASALAVGLGRAAKARPRGAERWLAIWPLGLLGGWLAIASAINILTVLTAKGLIGPETALPAALVGIVVVAVIGVAFTLRTRITASAVPIAWGLAGVYVAERSGNPVAAWSALGASVVVGLAAVAAGRRNFRVR
jgi:cell division protein FtsW (lipid II flippase)